jgi:hypothetical protein
VTQGISLLTILNISAAIRLPQEFHRTHIFGFYAKIRSSAAAAVWWCSVLFSVLYVVPSPSRPPPSCCCSTYPSLFYYSETSNRKATHHRKTTNHSRDHIRLNSGTRTATVTMSYSYVNMAALRIGGVLILGCVLVFSANLQSAAAGGNTLVLLDNLIIKETHSIFFKSLTGK